MEAGASRRARISFGQDGPEEQLLAHFLVAAVPVVAVRQHLVRREPPPPIVDRLIRVTYAAVIADYRLKGLSR
jgi:hypothetical protein